MFASERAPAMVSEILERRDVEQCSPHFPGAGCALVHMRVLWRVSLSATVFAHQHSTSRLLHFELIRAPVGFIVADVACSTRTLYVGLAIFASENERAPADVFEMFHGYGVE